MQAVVVDCISVVDPQLAPIIRVNAELIIACPSYPQHTCPTHGKMIASGKTAPFTVRVAVVHHLDFTSHVWPTPVQVLAPPTLPEVKYLLSEASASAREGAHNPPPVSGISASIPEQHPCMTTTLKHLNSHCMCPRTKMLYSLPIAPSMQSIVVDGVPFVDPQLAPIIGDKAEPVMTRFADSQRACPSHCEVIAPCKTAPFSVCVAVVHCLDFASHVRSATIQILAPTALAKIEDLLQETRATRTTTSTRASPCAK
jgi:hypothetical protein